MRLSKIIIVINSNIAYISPFLKYGDLGLSVKMHIFLTSLLSVSNIKMFLLHPIAKVLQAKLRRTEPINRVISFLVRPRPTV